MTYMPQTDDVGTGIRHTLTETETAFIRSGIAVHSDNADTIVGTSHMLTVNIQGTVSSALFSALVMGDDQALDYSQQLLIGAGGYVAAGFGYAVELKGYDSTIENRGEIWASAYGIEIAGDRNSGNPGTSTTFFNAGTVRGDSVAVHHLGSETFVLTNTGRIVSGNTAFSSDNASRDTIINRGEIDGIVSLGAGNDRYDGSKGSLDGVVDGGSGNDVIICGADNDQIVGGACKDVLTGGKGADEFLFSDPYIAANLDRITDFQHGVDQLSFFDVFLGANFASGTIKNSAFFANMTGQAHDTSDRFIYEKDTGRLYFDADGTGDQARYLLTTLGKNLALDHGDIYVYHYELS